MPKGGAFAAKLLLLAALLPTVLRGDAPAGHVRDSGLPGPRVLVVAGLHGDEPSGIRAAKALAVARRPKRGALVFLSEAHAEAIAAGTRMGGDPPVDLNRAFPGAEGSLADGIFSLALGADLVFDLHESGEAWPESDRPTLVVSPAAAPFALELLEALERRGAPFAFTGGAPAGSLVGELGARERNAFVVEIPARYSMGKRVRLHRLVVETACGLLGMR